MIKKTILLIGIIAMSLMLNACGKSESVQAVDVHSHYIPQEYMSFAQEHNALMDELYPIPEWNEESLKAFTDNAGIARPGRTR